MPARGSGRHHAAHGHGPKWPALIVIATGDAVAALAFVTTAAAARILLANGPASVAGLACPGGDDSSPSACPAAAPSANPGGRPAGTALPATAGSPTAERPPLTATAQAPGPTAAAAQQPGRTAASPSSAGPGSAVDQVLSLINTARGRAGLPGYTITAGLRRSSERHNARMAAGCGLSHQCRGEPSIGERETDAGVHWTTAGENIGDGGPVADSPAAIARMAVMLTQDMLNEHPPGDGHRKNILSTAFRHIGIAIVRDRSGTVWLTQDFSDLAAVTAAWLRAARSSTTGRSG